MHNGVPFDTAIHLTCTGHHTFVEQYENEVISLAMVVGFGEIQGGEFLWHSMKWKEKK